MRVLLKCNEIESTFEQDGIIPVFHYEGKKFQMRGNFEREMERAFSLDFPCIW